MINVGRSDLTHGTLGAAIVLAAPFVLSAAIVAPVAHREGPPPGHTGGFGEPTCQVCHQEYGLNEGEGSLVLRGLPDRIEAGTTYSLELILSARGTDVAGFQLATRTSDGRQAGTLSPIGPGMAVDTAEGPAGRLHYLRHTRAGTRADGREAYWSFSWTAPRTLPESVRFDAAANSANGDNSPFGDLVFSTSTIVSAGESPHAAGHRDRTDPSRR